MAQEFVKAKQLIDRSRNILLTMHERMDGDDGGSALAMACLLDLQGKNTDIAIKRGVPPQLKFLPGSQQVQDDIAHENYDLLIMFGCATRDRCGSERIVKLDVPVINFDHHPDNALYGDVNVVDKAKSSVAELVYDYLNFHGIFITKDMATCLLTGIITDTGSFVHTNTQTSTLEAAAELMRRGALTEKIIRHTFKGKTPQTLKAWGKAIENSYYDSEKRIIYSVMSEEDLKEFSHLPQSAFEGLVEMLNTVPEARFAMFLRQDGQLVKGSLRSGNDGIKKVDVAKIAQLFGGGGHKQAAGFSLAGKLVKDERGHWKVV